MDYKEKKMLSRLINNISKNGAIVDVGGFKGMWTNYVRSIFLNKNKKIYIFEPNNQNFSSLEVAFSTDENIKLINKGVGEMSTISTYFDLKGNDSIRPMSGFVKREVYDNYEYDTIELDVISLDEYEFDEEFLDFVKIDVEGYEFDVLKGMKKLLSESKVKFIQFEYGGTYLDADIKLNELIDFLSDYEYKVYSFNGNEFTHLINFDDNYQYDNFIATKENI